MRAADLAQALSARQTGRNYVANCPACGYKRALTIAEGQSGPLVYCHACRDSRAVIVARN